MKLLTNPFKQALIITLTLTCIISCKRDQSKNNSETQILQAEIDSLKNEITILNAQSEPKTNKRPNNIIQSDFAKEIYHLYDKREEYINRLVRTDSEGKPFRATRSLFYDINDLEHYIGYVKTLSKKAGVEPTGLRFYFALYPDDYARKGEGKAYAKRQTIFIAPTLEQKGNEQVTHPGYTLDNNFKVVLLSKKLGFDPILGFNNKLYEDSKYQKAGFFNLSSFQENNSLIADEVQGSPPNPKN